MTDVPSVKGSVIAEVVDDMQKLRARGVISQSQFETHLDPDQRSLVEHSLKPTEWYPVEFYRRCVELLREVAGHGRDEYVRERGFNRGNALMEAGLYQQMEYANRAQVQKHSDPQARFEAYGRDLRLFVIARAADLDGAEAQKIPIDARIATSSTLCWRSRSRWARQRCA